MRRAIWNRGGVAAMVGCLVWAGMARGVALTFTAPAVATPPVVVVGPGNVKVISDTLQLSPSSVWGSTLATTLADQGFTAEYGWLEQVDSVTLGTTAGYTVVKYSTVVTPAAAGGTVDQTVKFTLDFGNTNQPAGATLHWLQLLQEDKQYGTDEGGGTPFGYTLAGQPGFWQVDNGDLANAGTGVAPYYDSNSGPATVPPTFFDEPTVGSAVPGTYLHFWTIPVWDVLEGGTQHQMMLGDQGISWGYLVVPEPGSVAVLVIGLVGAMTRRRRG